MQGGRDLLCEIFLNGKLDGQPFLEKTSSRTNFLEIIHLDICGFMKTESNRIEKYFTTLINDYSRRCKVFVPKKRSDILEILKAYKIQAENQTGLRIKVPQTDNGK